MTTYYIKPSYDDAVTLNQDCMFIFVTEDGINFKFPFSEGTTAYIDVSDEVFYVDERIASLPTNPSLSTEKQAFYADMLAAKKDQQEAIAAGWIPDPNIEPHE